ncbi:MAG: SMC family ATPase [Candidatus Brocadiae bacterium]|nr:SMC family ATPase [Candidatus Brocadiia bacterium]
MKVLKLRLEGFTCFRKPVEVDFSELDLFAITGPTGSGKSSLVDAILFALYGKIPRLGTETSSLISQGMKNANVLLEFSMGESRYKVARKLSSAKGSQAILDQFSHDSWQGVCSGVRPVNQKIGQILGLDYDAFTRCIVLPQGEFANFLEDSKGRQEILIRLLDLGILEEMQKEASQKYEQIKDKIESIQKRLQDEFSGVTLEKMQELKETYKTLEKKIQETQEEVQSFVSSMKEAQEVWDLMVLMKEHESKQKALLSQEAKIKKLEEKIALSKKILPLVPQLEQYQLLSARSLAWQKKLELAKEKQNQWENQQKEQASRMELAQKNYERIPELDWQCERFQECKGWQEKLLSMEKEITERQNFYRKEYKRKQDIEQHLQKLLSYLENLYKQQKEQEKKLSEMEIQKQVLQKFQGADAFKSILIEASQNSERKLALFQDALKGNAEKEQKYKSLLAAYDKWESSVKKLQEELEKYGDKKQMEKRLLELEQASQLQERWKYHIQEESKEKERLEQEEKQYKDTAKKLSSEEKSLALLKKKSQETSEDLLQKEAVFSQISQILEPYQKEKSKADIIQNAILALEKHRQKLSEEKEEMEKRKQEISGKKDRLFSQVEQCKESWTHLYTNNLAGSIRQHIKPGMPCPVCGNDIKNLPLCEPGEKESFQEVQKRLEQKQKELQKIEKQMTEQETLLNALVLEQAEKQKEWESERKSLQEIQSRIEAMEEKLCKIMGQVSYQEQAEKFAKEIAILSKEKEKIQNNLLEKQSIIREHTAAIGSLEKRKEERKQSISQHQEQKQTLENKIQSLSGGADILKTQEEIKKSLEYIQECQKKLAQSEKNFSDISLQKEIASEQRNASQKRLMEAQEEMQNSTQEQKQKEDMIKKKLGIDVKNIQETLMNGIKQYQDVCLALDQLSFYRQEMTKRISEQEILKTRQEAILAEINQTLEEKKQSAQSLQQEHKDLLQKIMQITQGKDAQMLLQNCKKQKEIILASYQKLREESLILEQEKKILEQEWQNLQENIRETVAEKEKLQEILTNIQKEFSLQNLEELLSLKVDMASLQSWENQIVQQRFHTKEVENRIEECQKKLMGRSTSLEIFQQCKKNLEDTQYELSQKIEEKGRRLQEIQYMEANLSQIEGWNSELRSLQKQEEIQKILAHDLRANRFPVYVLEEALKTLVEDASVQFDMLSSGRYTFSMLNRDIYVNDSWNSGQLRLAKTLSGGETFIASLALALALAERIYQLGHSSGGSAILESLFLDEGFGSLDEESLDIVVKALSNLQDTGRTIGIISHLPVLNNYLPARLVVHKDREGSTVARYGQ